MPVVIKKLMILVLVLAIVGSLGTYLFFRHQIDHTLGGNTLRVDSSQFESISGSIAITDVNVLSSDSESMLKNQTVLINGSEIQSVSSSSEIPRGYHVVDVKGKYLIPGLIDSHVHLKKSKNDLLLYVANGITQVGEMTGMEHHFDHIEEINNGFLGPGLYIASPKLTSQKGWNAFFRSVFEKRHQNYLTPDEAKDAVRNYKSKNYQAIKLSSDLSPEIYYAINEEAQKQHIPVIGHLPVGLELDDLYRSRQSQLAHIDSIIQNLANEFGGLTANRSNEFLQHIESQSDSIAKTFKQRNIAISSTVWLHKTRVQQAYDLPEFFKSIPLEYQNPGWLEGSAVSRGCLPGGNSYEFDQSDSETRKKEIKTQLQTYNQAIKIITQALVQHGVTVTAGTDALGACGMIAGFSLHHELETLHEYGLTQAQALQAATSVPAQWMGVKTGVIEKGYRADLVLLNQNPLEDIRHTRSIEAVVVSGKFLDRNQLDEILRQVKKANNESRKISIDAFLN